MTVEEAIQVLERNTFKGVTPADVKLNNAIKLGIEALKFLEEERRKVPYHFHGLLPGETGM